MEFGEWILPLFRVIARFKFLRGTPLDIFGYSAERKRERQLISEYEATIERLLRDLTSKNHEAAVAIGTLPEQIRGYGHIKDRSIDAAKQRERQLLAEFDNPSASTKEAAE